MLTGHQRENNLHLQMPFKRKYILHRLPDELRDPVCDVDICSFKQIDFVQLLLV